MRSAVLALLLLSGCAGSCQAVGGGAIGAGTVGAGSVGGLVSGSAAVLPPGDPDIWLAAHKESFNDSDAVGTWTDYGLLGADVTQATEVARPTFKSPCSSGKLGGAPCLRFDGGDQLSSGAFAAGDQPALLCFVGMTSDTATRFFVDKTSGGATNRVVIWSAASAYSAFAGTATISGGTISAGSYINACFTANGASSTLRVNGSQVASGSAGTTTLASIRVGLGNSGTGYLLGDMLEVLYYEDPGSVTAADVESYFVDRYGSFPQ